MVRRRGPRPRRVRGPLLRDRVRTQGAAAGRHSSESFAHADSANLCASLGPGVTVPGAGSGAALARAGRCLAPGCLVPGPREPSGSRRLEEPALLTLGPALALGYVAFEPSWGKKLASEHSARLSEAAVFTGL